MEEIVIISAAAFFTALLTFFSGFGLGTILAPVFAVFFPVEVAIALTAVVHFANNLFKGALIGKNANWSVLLKFGLPAFAASFAGAWLLIRVAGLKPLCQYNLWGETFEVTPVKVMVAVLLIFFSLFEILPAAQRLYASSNKMIFGGLLSGFFGGLSGMQGAIRSAFLLKSGLSKESYIGTGVIIACLVDVSRLAVYASHFASINLQENLTLLVSACLSAFIGAYTGRKVLKKVTFRAIQILVGVMLIMISLALGAGFI